MRWGYSQKRCLAYLHIPTVLDVDEGGVVDNRETEDENISFGITQGSNTSITLLFWLAWEGKERTGRSVNSRAYLLTSCIPKRELNLFSFDNDSSFVVVEYSGNVFSGELALSIGNQHAGFAYKKQVVLVHVFGLVWERNKSRSYRQHHHQLQHIWLQWPCLDRRVAGLWRMKNKNRDGQLWATQIFRISSLLQ